MIRVATTADIPIIAGLHIEGWKAAYGGLVDQAYLDGLSLDKRINDWTGWMSSGETEVLLAQRDGQPAGWIAYGRTQTPPPGSSPIRPTHSAEIYGIYLHPDYWRQGIGGELLSKAAENLKNRKHVTLCLWVLEGNKRGVSFYEKMGGQRIGKKMVTIGPSNLREICYGWRDISNLVPRS